MKDILPKEMAIRNYVMNMIRETYGTFGFSAIETPCVEHIENLCSKQGGENEKLIFKIMKRGEKLKLDTAKTENDLTDSGLRYDLTVPLSRYYSNNANELPAPFKALQMGNVWRADRPQRGRYRQFMQCDIDILGEPTNLAEIELILATTTLLGKLDFKNFPIRINDRRILKAMAKMDSDRLFGSAHFLYLHFYSKPSMSHISPASAVVLNYFSSIIFPFLPVFYANAASSKSIVNGPSFIKDTFISAPKIPVSTTGTCSFAFSIISSAY